MLVGSILTGGRGWGRKVWLQDGKSGYRREGVATESLATGGKSGCGAEGWGGKVLASVQNQTSMLRLSLLTCAHASNIQLQGSILVRASRNNLESCVMELSSKIN